MCLVLLLALAGCSTEPAGSGVTYEESEPQDVQPESGDPISEHAPPENGQIGDADAVDLQAPIVPQIAGPDTTPDADLQLTSSETVPAAESPEAGSPSPQPTGAELQQVWAASAGVELTPEQWTKLGEVELTPEQWTSLAAIQLLVPDQLFFKAGEALRVQFDNLDLEKVLNMTYIPPFAIDYFPEWMMELDGKRVRLRGYMYTTFDGVDSFLLCRDLGPCCFGPNPRPDYRIPIHLKDGEVTDYIHQTVFEVEGIFHVHLTIDDLGKVSHVYAVTEGTVIRL